MSTLTEANGSAPPANKLKAIRPGTFVELCTGASRFWVRVNTVNGDRIRGATLNTYMPSLGIGPEVDLEKRHIHGVFGL